MKLSRGLIIADTWIGQILDGRKDWEMRSQATSVRGWIGLIRKGSGTVVGLARLVDCGRALDQAEMIASIDRHRIPEDMIRRGEVAKWVVPWKLADIIPLDRPVSNEHRSGAVIWATLSGDVSSQLERYLDRSGPGFEATSTPPTRTIDHHTPLSAPLANQAPIRRQRPEAAPMPSLPEEGHKVLGRSVLSGGNIRNNHIKLAPIMHALPADAIGGSNKAEAASRHLEIDWGGPKTVMTDIDGTKSIFRARGGPTLRRRKRTISSFFPKLHPIGSACVLNLANEGFEATTAFRCVPSNSRYSTFKPTTLMALSEVELVLELMLRVRHDSGHISESGCRRCEVDLGFPLKSIG